MRHATAPQAYRAGISALPPEDGRGYLAVVPDLPGRMSDGASPREAAANVQDATRAWIEAADDLDHPVPLPSQAGGCEDRGS